MAVSRVARSAGSAMRASSGIRRAVTTEFDALERIFLAVCEEIAPRSPAMYRSLPPGGGLPYQHLAEPAARTRQNRFADRLAGLPGELARAGATPTIATFSRGSFGESRLRPSMTAGRFDADRQARVARERLLATAHSPAIVAGRGLTTMRAMGPWRSWERVCMACRRSRVRVPLAPVDVNIAESVTYGYPSSQRCGCTPRSET